MAYEYEFLTVNLDDRLAEVVIDNPPINLMTPQLYQELRGLCAELEVDENLSVVLFKSANPDFFIAHFDVKAILDFPTDEEPKREEELNPFHQMCEQVRTMDKVTIAQIEGRVGGGGSEFVSSMDMRFGVIDRTIINQMEVPIGILPGGSGTQRLPRLIGLGRAMEVVLGGGDLDAMTAERWGYLNRVFEADEVEDWVSNFAKRIAGFPVQAVRLAKAAVLASGMPLEEGLKEEAFLFAQLLRTPDAQTQMKKFLELGGQTKEGELRVADLSGELKIAK
jgi:enoyl-CoA hydratase/carnithine racemase